MSFVVPDSGCSIVFSEHAVTGALDSQFTEEYTWGMTTSPIRRVSAQHISHEVVTAAMKVHSELGAGLLESAYQACLQHELRSAGIHSTSEVGLPVVYRGVKLDVGYRIDLLVENLVIVEVKSVDSFCPVHHAQVISYLKLSGKSIGLLINFNVLHLRDGIKRFVNGTGWRESQVTIDRT